LKDGCSVGECDINFQETIGYAYLDPHFRGLNGHKYSFQGEPNTVFALISTSQVQINARFTNTSRKGSTVMGEICIRFCDSTVTFDSKGGLSLFGPQTSNLAVKYLSNTTAQVTVGLWSLTVELDKTHPELRAAFLNLLDVNLQHSFLAGPSHGVIGVTAPDRHHRMRSRNSTLETAHHPHCNPKNEGGCEVPGYWREYELKNNDLCSTEFKYSQFESSKCASIVADRKRGVAEVSLLEQVKQLVLI